MTWGGHGTDLLVDMGCPPAGVFNGGTLNRAHDGLVATRGDHCEHSTAFGLGPVCRLRDAQHHRGNRRDPAQLWAQHGLLLEPLVGGISAGVTPRGHSVRVLRGSQHPTVALPLPDLGDADEGRASSGRQRRGTTTTLKGIQGRRRQSAALRPERPEADSRRAPLRRRHRGAQSPSALGGQPRGSFCLFCRFAL